MERVRLEQFGTSRTHGQGRGTGATSSRGVGIRFIVDLEAGKPTLQLEKVLRVLATLGCDVAITPPPGDL